MMAKVLFYGYATNSRRSRQIAKNMHEDVGFRVPATGSFADHDTSPIPWQVFKGKSYGDAGISFA